ncbi:MAG: winged helix-turn-helix transcriptional regulator [Promethearchaeota archaeon]
MTTNESSSPKTKEPLIEIFSYLGRPCAVPIITALGERSYNACVRELRKKLDLSNGKNPSESAISKCLTDLTMLGLVHSADQDESPSEIRYSLTRTGQEVYKHILQMRPLAENSNILNDFFTGDVTAC